MNAKQITFVRNIQQNSFCISKRFYTAFSAKHNVWLVDDQFWEIWKTLSVDRRGRIHCCNIMVMEGCSIYVLYL